MKLIDKIKNYFYDEDEAGEPKKEAPSKSTPSKSKTAEVKEEKNVDDEKKKENLDVVSERDLFKSEPTFNFPIIFDEEDFKTDKVPNNRINTVKKEQTKIEVEKTEKKAFMPSPNISPIYGIIRDQTTVNMKDANDNLLNLYEDNKKVDIDDVLGKVYEQTRIEIKHESYEEVSSTPQPEIKEDLSLDFFDSEQKNNVTREKLKSKPNKKEIPTDDVDKKLKSIDELLENTSDDDFYSLVDSMYKENNEDEDGEE